MRPAYHRKFGRSSLDVHPAIYRYFAGSKLEMLTSASTPDGAEVAEGAWVDATVAGGTMFVEPAVMFIGAAAAGLGAAPLGEQAATPSPATTANAASRGGVILDLRVCVRREAFGTGIVVSDQVEACSDTYRYGHVLQRIGETPSV